jgi:hypothetical protein
VVSEEESACVGVSVVEGDKDSVSNALVAVVQ